MATRKEDTETLSAAPAPTFTKAQFLTSKAYSATQKDILQALLEDGKSYTQEEVSKMMDQFMKRTVK